MSYAPFDGTGAFVTFVFTAPEKARQAVHIAAEVFKRFVEEGLTDKELLAAKNKIASGATLQGELPMGRLAAVGFDWVYRKEYVPLARQIETRKTPV